MTANLSYSQIFLKHYKKRIVPYPNLNDKFKERTNILLTNPENHILKNHPLKGKQSGFRSFSVTGDVRVIYKQLNPSAYYFYDVGTHNQVYK